MQYAKLLKLGGQVIEASSADYEDYKGFLLCPECGESVFLRKAYQRGESIVKSAFVHHRAIPEVSKCELRVGSYSLDDIKAFASQARGQRLASLRVSMWKYLKTTMAINLKQWSFFVSQAKQGLLKEVVDYGVEVLANNVAFIVEGTLPRVSDLVKRQDSRIWGNSAVTQCLPQTEIA